MKRSSVKYKLNTTEKCKAALQRPFILFEIIIGLSLLSVILSLLFSFFTSSAKMERKLDQAQFALLERQHLQTRLQSVLSSIVPPKTPEASPSLYTKQQSLIVFFDNGIDPDPAFSGPISARIYLDEENCLCMALWPQDQKTGFMRREVLLNHVSAFTFRFLARNVDHTIEWKSQRLQEERKEIPSLICLEVWQGVDKKQEEEPNLKFAFILPSQEPIIRYTEEPVAKLRAPEKSKILSQFAGAASAPCPAAEHMLRESRLRRHEKVRGTFAVASRRQSGCGNTKKVQSDLRSAEQVSESEPAAQKGDFAGAWSFATGS